MAAVKGMGQPPPLHVGRQSVFISAVTLCTLLTPPNWTRFLSCTSWFNTLPGLGGELCGRLGGAVRGSCVGELCGRSCVGAVGGYCVRDHFLQLSQRNEDLPLPSHQLPPVQPLPCPCTQQQPGSPLQSVSTSPTACSSACAPSSSLSC